MAKADFGHAKSAYPSTAMLDAEWLQAFDEKPDIMWAILGDIYNVVRDEQERAAGIRRMGRRPTRAAGSIEELWRTVFPEQYSLEPFPAAFATVLGVRSQRSFARKVPCNQATISRLLGGHLAPDMAMMESIASAAKINPAFFREWRALKVAELIRIVLTEQPHIGVSAIKRLKAGARAFPRAA